MSRVPRLPLLILAALLLTVSACGSDDRATPETAASRHPRTAEPSDSATPTPTSTPTPTPDASPTAPPEATKPKQGQKPPVVMGQPLHRSTLRSHLLTAARMPSGDGVTVWEVADDGPEGAVVVGACQKTDLETIGAVSAVRRSFASGSDGAVATQVVAEFADPKSAWRAHEVLRSWQADCEARLDFARKEVGPLRPVTVRAGNGESYRTAYGPRSEQRGWATGLGIVRRGSYLSVVEVLTARTDYPSEWDPSRKAVRRIAGTFA
jgi:hypothetical protein